ADPAALDQLPEGILEAGGRGDAAVGAADAAFAVAGAVERGQNLLAELRRLAQNGFDNIGRGVGKARQITVTVEMEDVVQQEQRVIHWRLVGRHRQSPRVRPGVNGLRNERFRNGKGRYRGRTMTGPVYTCVKRAKKPAAAAPGLAGSRALHRQNGLEHAGVDRPQLRQRELDIATAALEKLDLLDAFFTADRQRLVAAAGAGGQHVADFAERETQPLALQDDRQPIAVGPVINP